MYIFNTFSHIIMSLAAYFIITISPGPANIAVMSVAMKYGKQQGLSMVGGIVSASICWGIIAAAGLATFLNTNERAFYIVKILGGLYLCLMAYNAFRSALTIDSSKAIKLSARDQNNYSLWNFYLRGFVIHMTNPKAVFAWSSVMILGLKPTVSVLSLAFILIIGGCMLQGIVVSFYALIFSTKKIMNFYNNRIKIIESVLGLLFGAVGINMFLSVLNS
jgi:threonine/homoserine/homoserine lactone efflux protein